MRDQFTNYDRAEHFTSFYNSNSDGNFDVSRPVGFNIVKVKSVNSGVLESLNNEISEKETIAQNLAGNIDSSDDVDAAFIDCLSVIAKSMVLKGIRKC